MIKIKQTTYGSLTHVIATVSGHPKETRVAYLQARNFRKKRVLLIYRLGILLTLPPPPKRTARRKRLAALLLCANSPPNIHIHAGEDTTLLAMEMTGKLFPLRLRTTV